MLWDFLLDITPSTTWCRHLLLGTTMFPMIPKCSKKSLILKSLFDLPSFYFFRYGRVRFMVPCTLLAIIVAFLSSFATHYWLFAISRFIIGFAAPGTITMFFVVASESVGPRYRPITGITLWIFFTLSLVILGVVAMHVREWKWLMIYSTAPYFILLPLML